MPFLRFICLLPIKILLVLLKFFLFILRPIIGQVNFTWSAPKWIAPCRKRKKLFAYGFPSCLVVIVLAYCGVYWYQHRPIPPIPNLVKIYAIAPSITDYKKTPPTIYPLRINFSGSAAPLDKVGKKFPNLFTITPETKGVWHWTSDHALSFQPQTDWNAGQTYSIDFTKPDEFNPNIIIRNAKDINNTNPTVSFTTVAFDAKISNKAFQQDDQHPMIKKGIFTISFNMLVDPISFEKNIHLSLATYIKKKNTSLFSSNKDKDIIEKTEQKIPFNVVYDKQKLTATIVSENLPIPNDNSKLELTINPGTTSQLGHGTLSDKMTASVDVPSKYTLTINNLSTHIATDEKNNSDQILEVDFNSPVNDDQVSHNISAWILPPLDNNDSPWDTKTLIPQAISHFTPLKLTLIPAENNAQTIQSFKYKTDPNQQILVKINTGIQSTGGYVLNNPYMKILNVPNYPKRLNFMSDGALLSLHGSNKVSVASQNLTGVKMVIGQLRPNQLQHLVSQRSSNDNYNQTSLKYSFTDDNITNRYEQKISFDNKPSHNIRYDGFDLSSYLHKGLHGVFILHLYEYDQNAERKEKQAKHLRNQINRQRTFAIGATPSNSSDVDDNDSESYSDEDGSALTDNRLIVITDLGMIVKKSLDGSQDVFIQSISSGSPVANAEVSVMGLNGEKLITKTTDNSGITHFPNLQGFSKDKEPILYVVTKGDDLSFLPIRKTSRSLDFSRFNVGGDINTIHKKEISAYLFSDRGIYRTGEEFHIGMVIKAADWQNSLNNLPLKLVITDPTGKSYESMVTVGQDGFNEYTNNIGENNPNGTWQISLLTIDPKDKNWSQEIGSTTIKVKDFLPEQTRVSAEFSESNPKGWVKPEQLKAVIEAKNLFGTPASNRRVEASIKVSPFIPQFEQWKEYQFSINDSDRLKESFEDTLQEEKTNDQGKAIFDLNLKKYANSSYNLSFLGQVYEPDSGRSVAATAQAIVSSNNYMVGYHSTDDIYNIKINSSIKPLHLIAINPQAELISLSELKIRLIEKRYVSVLIKQSSGLYKYESKPRETTLSETSFSIAKNGSDYSIKTDKAGDYKAVILDKDNNELNVINYSIIGAGNLSRSLERNTELNISLNKKSYKPGEEIEVAIRAPYTGSGLITIEKDKVYAHTWFHTDTTSSIQHIIIPPELDGNGYINVQFVRDPSSDEIFMSPLSYGVVPFSIDLEQHKNPLAITAPEITKDRKIIFTVTSERPTRIILWAVDKGILQVSKYKLPNPLGYFFSKKMLDVQTLQILDQILPEFNQLLRSSAASGGDEESPFTQRVNPFKRKQDKPVVFWSGIVDINGSKDFTYDAPDYFNGTLQVMALSVSDEQIGVTSKESIIRDDFVLKPNAPTTLTPGDESEVSVLVANNLEKLNGQKVPVTVSLKTTSQFQVIGNNTQKLSLGEKQDAVVKFRIKALNHDLGSGDLIFSVNYNQSLTRNTTHVLLRPASPYRTQVNMSKVDAGKTKTFSDLRNVYPNNALHYAAFSNLPIVIIQGLGTYLMDYEHLCSEQIVSHAFALLAIQNKPELKSIFAQTDPKQITSLDTSLDQIIGTLQERQNSAGAFGLWRSTPNADNFITSYVTFFLQNVSDQGKNVSQSTLNKAYTYLKDYAVNGSNDNLTDMRSKAFAIYILTKQGNVTTSAISSLVKDLNTKYKDSWKQDSTAAWLAASMKLMKQDEAAGQMMAEPLKELQRDPKASNLYWDYEGYDGGDLAQDATILYLVSQHFPSLLPNLSENAFTNILNTIEQGYYNTLSSSLTVMAFDAYSANIKDDTKNLLIQAMREDTQKQPTVLKTSQLKNGIQVLNWQQGSTSSLNFNNQSSIKAWYSVIQRGFDESPPKTALQQKMEIIRDYTDQKNNPVSSVKVGQEILVHIKFRSTDNKTHDNIAITDLLPSGFDLVADTPEANNSNVENNGFYPDFINKQEDKIQIYTSVTKNIQEYVYRIKATNAGKYIIPPAYGEGMYNPSIQARSLSGGYLSITSAK